MSWGWSLLVMSTVLGGVLTLSALAIWIERRLLGIWQERFGPNRVGPVGILQSARRHDQDFHQGRLDSAVRRSGRLRADARDRGRDDAHVVCRGAVRRRDSSSTDLNIGAAVLSRDVVVWRAYSVIAGRLGLEQQVRVSRRACGPAAQIVELRSVHGALPDGRRAAGRLL